MADSATQVMSDPGMSLSARRKPKQVVRMEIRRKPESQECDVVFVDKMRERTYKESCVETPRISSLPKTAMFEIGHFRSTI